MKLANAPGRKLTRTRGALARFNGYQARIVTTKRPNPRTYAQWDAEKARLMQLCAVDDNFARGIKTKKNHAHLAKIRMGAA